MKKRYEVQHFTLCDGWVNTWTIPQEVGDSIYTDLPETFAGVARHQLQPTPLP